MTLPSPQEIKAAKALEKKAMRGEWKAKNHTEWVEQSIADRKFVISQKKELIAYLKGIEWMKEEARKERIARLKDEISKLEESISSGDIRPIRREKRRVLEGKPLVEWKPHSKLTHLLYRTTKEWMASGIESYETSVTRVHQGTIDLDIAYAAHVIRVILSSDNFSESIDVSPFSGIWDGYKITPDQFRGIYRRIREHYNDIFELRLKKKKGSNGGTIAYIKIKPDKHKALQKLARSYEREAKATKSRKIAGLQMLSLTCSYESHEKISRRLYWLKVICLPQLSDVLPYAYTNTGRLYRDDFQHVAGYLRFKGFGESDVESIHKSYSTALNKFGSVSPLTLAIAATAVKDKNFRSKLKYIKADATPKKIYQGMLTGQVFHLEAALKMPEYADELTGEHNMTCVTLVSVKLFKVGGPSVFGSIDKLCEDVDHLLYSSKSFTAKFMKSELKSLLTPRKPTPSALEYIGKSGVV